MGFFDRFKKKDQAVSLPKLTDISDEDIVAIADGTIIDIKIVPDDVFAQEMMCKSIAFHFDGDQVVLCAPASGTLSVLFPTGHAFGVTMKNGLELLVHCGINTVDAKGDGFRLLDRKQGDVVEAGDPIVEVNLKKLSEKYNLSTILIITNANGKTIDFIEPQSVKRGQIVTK